MRSEKKERRRNDDWVLSVRHLRLSQVIFNS